VILPAAGQGPRSAQAFRYFETPNPLPSRPPTRAGRRGDGECAEGAHEHVLASHKRLEGKRAGLGSALRVVGRQELARGHPRGLSWELAPGSGFQVPVIKPAWLALLGP